jgi:hypothetical protein
METEHRKRQIQASTSGGCTELRQCCWRDRTCTACQRKPEIREVWTNQAFPVQGSESRLTPTTPRAPATPAPPPTRGRFRPPRPPDSHPSATPSPTLPPELGDLPCEEPSSLRAGSSGIRAGIASAAWRGRTGERRIIPETMGPMG